MKKFPGAILVRSGGLPFDADSLTEDYELGLRLRATGGRSIFVRLQCGGTLVATQEYFPGTIGAAVACGLLSIGLTPAAQAQQTFVMKLSTATLNDTQHRGQWDDSYGTRISGNGDKAPGRGQFEDIVLSPSEHGEHGGGEHH